MLEVDDVDDAAELVELAVLEMLDKTLDKDDETEDATLEADETALESVPLELEVGVTEAVDEADEIDADEVVLVVLEHDDAEIDLLAGGSVCKEEQKLTKNGRECDASTIDST